MDGSGPGPQTLKVQTLVKLRAEPKSAAVIIRSVCASVLTPTFLEYPLNCVSRAPCTIAITAADIIPTDFISITSYRYIDLGFLIFFFQYSDFTWDRNIYMYNPGVIGRFLEQYRVFIILRFICLPICWNPRIFHTQSIWLQVGLCAHTDFGCSLGNTIFTTTSVYQGSDFAVFLHVFLFANIGRSKSKCMMVCSL